MRRDLFLFMSFGFLATKVFECTLEDLFTYLYFFEIILFL